MTKKLYFSKRHFKSNAFFNCRCVSCFSITLHNFYLSYFIFSGRKTLGILVQHKVRSGVSGIMGMEVDGLPFPGVHAEMIQKLADITEGHM